MIAIRKEFPDAKIIILTTYESDVQGAIKLRAGAYLLKTHLDKELLGIIQAVTSWEIEAAAGYWQKSNWWRNELE